jgi:serine phosphatase RsbU (regulator of sigma subunit)
LLPPPIFLDLENSIVNYAGAGHPPLLVWRKSSGSVTEVLESGLFLGPFHDSTYSAVPLSLEGADRIILYTDGIIEARNPSGEEFGIDRFKGIVEGNHALPADQFADTLLDGVAHWSEKLSGPSQSDDMTLLAIDFKGTHVGKCEG